MPDFDYVVIDPAGREKAGRVKADSADAARAQLDGKKLFVVKLEAGREGAKKDSGSLLSLRRNRLSHKELTLFTRQLSTLSQVSPLEESLRTISRQSEKDETRAIISHVHGGVMEGGYWPKRWVPSRAAFRRSFVRWYRRVKVPAALAPFSTACPYCWSVRRRSGPR